ncbi:DoxX family protein [Saccharicrinis aurantiacus]|uniref:DoxX family protein n=1 Tax=Saccharicrinis aurantiacus TaxID=1849719 RepID=UPI00248F76BC|nr:DoxX family protein [Saccharicrinis aurantiacus]
MAQTIYWISTIIISAFLFISSYSYIFSDATKEGIKALGFPDFFRIELAVLKLLAAILILIPNLNIQLKEWTYGGIALFLVTAFVAHLKHRDSIFIMLLLVVLMLTLIVSYIYLHKRI